MTIRSAPRKMTYEDLLALPEDLLRHELIDGEHIVSPAPSVKHQRAVLRLAVILSHWVRPRAMGEVFTAPLDVRLSRFDVVEPDVLYVAAENAHRLLERCVDGAPDLAVEVLSPSSLRLDKIRKLGLFETYGVREYWLVDPDADVVDVYRRTAAGRLARAASLSLAAGDVLESPLFPGLHIPLQEIFG